MKLLYTIVLAAITLGALAQKPEKVMEKDLFAAMDARDQGSIDANMEKAKDNFKKILAKDKDNPMCHFGLAVIYGWDKYSKVDYFKAWNEFQIADEFQGNFTPEDLEILNLYFTRIDKKRRNRPINKNMAWEKENVEDKLIKFVREENNIEYANRFLEEFPDSRFYDNVRHIRNYIEYRLAENSNSIEAYNAFLVKYPESAQKEIAAKKRDALAYKNAIATNTLASLRAFMQDYPNAEQIEDIKKRVSVLAFEEAAQKGDVEALERFMNEFPNSTKMPEAKALKKKLLFEKAKSLNSLEAYNNFVMLYPEGEMYVDIFNLKSTVLGKHILMDFPMENYQFVKGYDNQQFDDYGGDIALKADGSILLAVNTLKAKDSYYDTWMLQLNNQGVMQTNQFLGNKFDDQVNHLKITANNEIYAAGITNAIGDSIPGQSWIFKIDANGKNLYNNKLEGTKVLSFAIYPNGNALVGSYLMGEDTLPHTLLTKVNNSGKKLWSRSYTFGSKIYDLAIANEIAYVAAGEGLLAVDALGYLVWDLPLEGMELTALSVGNAKLYAGGSTAEEALVIAYDLSGNETWRTTLPTPADASIEEIELLADGSILLAANYQGKMDLVKISASGEVADRKTFETGKGIVLNGMAVEGNNAVISATIGDVDRNIIVFKLAF